MTPIVRLLGGVLFGLSVVVGSVVFVLCCGLCEVVVFLAVLLEVGLFWFLLCSVVFQVLCGVLLVRG